MSTWYVCGKYHGGGQDYITPVEVVKETDHTILINNVYGKTVRTSKRSTWDNYFPTMEDAIEFLRDRLIEDQSFASEKVQLTNKQRNDFEKWAHALKE